MTSTQQDLNRTLYHHNWWSLDEWVSALDTLADLTDAEIEALVAEDRKHEGF